jgi:hypothetical protein
MDSGWLPAGARCGKGGATVNRERGRALGEAMRDQGLLLAGANRQRLIAGVQARFLDALLNSLDGTATTDDIPDNLGAKYPKGGKYVGSAIRALAEKRMIRREGFAKSCRPSRHSCYVTVWRAARDLDAIRAERERLRRLVAALDAADEPNATQSDLF